MSVNSRRLRRALVGAVAGLTIGGLAWAEVDLNKLPPPASKKGVTYAKDIKPILQASCFRCHGAERPKSGLRLDSLEGVMNGGDGGKIVIPGRSKESLLVLAASQLDEETAMPPKRMPGGPGGGGFGVGGPGGMGGGPGGMIASQMMKQGDKNDDKKLSKEEMGALAETWFDKLDSDKTGKVTQEQFIAKFAEIVPMPQRGAGPGGVGPGGLRGAGAQGAGGGQGGGAAGGGQAAPAQRGGPGGGGFGGGPGNGGFGPARFLAPGFFAAIDTDKDGSLTKPQMKETFEKWSWQFDGDKSGTLEEAELQAGLSENMPRPQFGGGGPGGAQGGRPGPGGFGGGGGGGGQAGRGGPGAGGGGGFGGRGGGQGGPGGPGGGGGFGGGPGGPGGGPGGMTPPKPLTADQVGLIRAWIDQGAK